MRVKIVVRTSKVVRWTFMGLHIWEVDPIVPLTLTIITRFGHQVFRLRCHYE